MSDYTPTTEEVRNKYSGFSTSNSNHTGQVYLNFDEFDRWLAEVKAEAWEQGQLALLEYMGVPLYPSKGDEPRNPKQPRNPYRQGEKQ